MESAATAKGSTWARASRELKARLAAELTPDEVRAFHEKRPWRHFLVLARQLALLAGATWVLAGSEPAWRVWLWIPAMLVQGFVVFDFTVLLHEVIHRNVFRTRRPRLERVLGLLYALPTGIAATQFARWHLDHHRHLGSDVLDPKRHHLSPKRVTRRRKLLYFTPALFAIYFRAAARETATYPAEVRRRIARERRAAIALHLAAIAGIAWFLSPWAAVRIHLVPLLVVFPVAFAINRLGQHYDILPDEPAGWATLVRSTPFWDVAFLWSNLHLEHHDYPGVPFYNLPALHRRLRPFLERQGLRPRGYAGLLVDWLVRNRAPHTAW